MKKCRINEGKGDRVIRLILAVVFFFLASLVLIGSWQIIFYILAIIVLLTSIFGYCPCYSICRINTNKKKEQMSESKIEEISKETVKEAENTNMNKEELNNTVSNEPAQEKSINSEDEEHNSNSESEDKVQEKIESTE